MASATWGNVEIRRADSELISCTIPSKPLPPHLFHMKDFGGPEKDYFCLKFRTIAPPPVTEEANLVLFRLAYALLRCQLKISTTKKLV